MVQGVLICPDQIAIGNEKEKKQTIALIKVYKICVFVYDKSGFII